MQIPKIISLVASYDPNNPYVGQVIEELKKVSTVYLFTTEEHQHKVEDSFYFPKSIKFNLVYKTREWIFNNIDKDWDFVIYNEDDILIPETSIKNLVGLYKHMPYNMKPGFIRCEIDNEGNKRYIDMHPAHAVQRGGSGTLKEIFDTLGVWEPWNIHSGNFMFSKEDIKYLIDNNRFEKVYREYGFQYGSCIELESCATCLYLNYTKVYPLDFKSVECFHLPNRYVNMHGVGLGNPTEQELSSILSLSK